MILALGAEEMSSLLNSLSKQDAMNIRLRDLKNEINSDRAARQQIIIDEKRQKMLDFIGTLDARKWQDSNIKLRQPGTGAWFTVSDEFKNWVSQEHSKLWIHGIPGAGKMILMASVIQRIETNFLNSTNALAFFFCDYKAPETHNPAAILGSLARQMVVQHDACFKDLMDFYEEHKTPERTLRQPVANELIELISTLATRFQSIMIVVDGLDEISKGRADVARLLRQLNEESGCKTLFASRHEVDIGYVLGDFPQVSIAARSSDLRMYILSEIKRRTEEKKLMIRDPALTVHIVKTLEEKAEGMFRWVACQMDYLCECSTDRDRCAALSKLPRDLPSSYQRILERVNGSTKENQDLVGKCLHWIILAKKPLSTEGLLQALAVRDGETFFDPSGMTTEEELLHWCSSLIRKATASNHLEVAHFTVKEFLLGIDPLGPPEFLQYRITDDHQILAKSCINFLKCRQFGDIFLPTPRSEDYKFEGAWNFLIENYTFLLYASQNWVHHVHSSNWEAIEETLMSFFEPTTSRDIPLWAFAWMESDYGCYGGFFYACNPLESSLAPSLLHWAAIFAFDKIGTYLINKKMDVNQMSYFGTPLRCCMFSKNAIFRPPSGEGAENKIENWKYKTTTIEEDYWYKQSRESLMRALIAAGSDPNGPVHPSCHDTRPLEIALRIELRGNRCSRPFITRILMDAGAEFSSKALEFAQDQLYLFQEENDLSPQHWNPSGGKLVAVDIFTQIAGCNLSNLAIVPAALAEYFAYVLMLVSEGCPVRSFQPLLEIVFTETPFERPLTKECLFNIEQILLSDLDPRSKIIRLACTVLLQTGTSNSANYTIARILSKEVDVWDKAMISSILESLDFSRSWRSNVAYEAAESLCSLLFQLADPKLIDAIELMTLRKVDFTFENASCGIVTLTWPEHAAKYESLAVFSALWNSLCTVKSPETTPTLIEKIVKAAQRVRPKNEDVLNYLLGSPSSQNGRLSGELQESNQEKPTIPHDGKGGQQLGSKALYVAVLMGAESIAKSLLLHEPGPDYIEQHTGEAILHAAARSNSKTMIKCLLEHCASTTIKNNDGLTAEEVALSCGYVEISSMIRHYPEIVSEIKVDTPEIISQVLPIRSAELDTMKTSIDEAEVE